jgi:hypothetical protein
MVWTIILLLLIITIIIVSIYSNGAHAHDYERFGNSLHNPFQQIEKEGEMSEISARLFNDVIVYENDLDGKLGIDKCLDNESGHCVEYGISGVAYYYPD